MGGIFKKLQALLATSATAAMALFGGCKKAADTVATLGMVEVDLDSIRSRGTLRAVTDYNSVNYFVHKGVAVGYQYELLSEYAKHIGVDLEILADNTLEGGYEKLKCGKADILASTLVADTTLLPPMSLCEPYGQSRMVLVSHASSKRAKATKTQDALENDTICAMANSFYSRLLENVADTASFDMTIREIPHYDAEQLVGLVAEKEIPQTICLESIARASQWYYDSLTIGHALTGEINLSWGVRATSASLRKDISLWMKNFKRTSTFKRIYRKYVIDPREHHNTSQSTSASTYQDKYENLIKGVADDKRYNWILLSSIIYQESHFNANATSWAGAAGLMQLMPETAARFDVYDLSDPEQNVRAGFDYLMWLDRRLTSNVTDPQERVKFTIAAYNVGLGHIMDAIRLAQKFGRKAQVWDSNVETALLLKANPAYYSDPVVKHGFCRGTETISYVKNVMERYANYKKALR